MLDQGQRSSRFYERKIRSKFWPRTVTPAAGRVSRGCVVSSAQSREHQVSGSNAMQQRTFELTPGFPVLGLLRFGLRVAEVQTVAV